MARSTRGGARSSRAGSRAARTQRGGLFRVFRAIGGEGRAWWVKTIRWFAFLGLMGIITGAATFFVLYQAINIPDANADFQTQTTRVYYSDGVTEIGSFATQNRESITLDQIPETMQAAVIAAEDRSFYNNNGIDLRGIIRALRNNATSGSTQGASTITQQYVKILYLTQERTYTRKVKEAILSLKVARQLSKDEILEGYLNTVYYGNGAYGVQVAAKTYYGKPASELTVPEAAALATIINSPTAFDPYSEGGQERMLGRYQYVIDGMAKVGAITPEEAAQFSQALPAFQPQQVSNRFGGTNGYLLSMVQKEMADLKFSETDVNGRGLRITTTFDAPRQAEAVESVQKVAPQNLPELNEALVSVEPGTGAVRALYGGPDFLVSQINWATQGTQPGSTFKIFAVIAGLEDGFSLKTSLNGNSPYRIGGAEIENQGDSGGASFGTRDLTFATAKSVNTAFIDLTEQMSDGGNISVGAEKIKEAALEAGIPQSTVDRIDPVAVTSLGFAPVAPIDMANAYATIVAGGLRAKWYVVEKVTSAGGEVLHQHEVKTERTIASDVAADTLAAIQGVVNSAEGTGRSAQTVCPTAGKTGTATAGEGRDVRVSSSWFVGATPKLATAVMYNRGDGNDQLDGYLRPFFGGRFPATTFKTYMDQAVDRKDCGTFIPAANKKATKGTQFKPPPPTCPEGQQLTPDQNACEPIPVVPTPEPTPTPTPSPTPTPTPTVGTPGGPVDPTRPQVSEANCVAAGGTWRPSFLGQPCRFN